MRDLRRGDSMSEQPIVRKSYEAEDAALVTIRGPMVL